MKTLLTAILGVLLAGAGALADTQPEAQPAQASSVAESQVSALKSQVEKPQTGNSRSDRPAALAGLADTSREEPVISSSAYSMIKGLMLCLGILFVGVHFMKRMTPHRPGARGQRRLAVVERLPISSRSAIVLLEVDGKPVLASVGSEQVQFFAAGQAAAGFSESLEGLCARDLEVSAT